MRKTKQAFSMVELIIAISIVIILWMVAVTSMDSVKDKSNNTRILSDIDTLKNGFKSYLQEKSEYPMPKWNLKFYGEDTGYRHTYDDAFWVSGFVTDDTLPKKYLNNLLLDPKTQQYYAYAKTKNTDNFEIAWVVFENNNPSSFVSWDWKWETWPYNLVKEYAWPNFVFDKSTEYFAYNPYEKMLVAKISSFSGTVEINGASFTDTEILTYNLWQWDRVSISTGWTLNLYYSDGSSSVLGDTLSRSEVVLANMKFVEDNNLFTSIKLALNVGSLWTKASKLSDKSDFEVYTTDAVAAVRGTIFWVTKSGALNSNLVVQEWKVEVKDVPVLTSGETIENKIEKGENIGTSFTPEQTGWVMQIESNKSYIEVLPWTAVKWVKVENPTGTPPSNPTASTWSIATIPTEAQDTIIKNIPELNENIQTEVQNYSKSGTDLKINLTLNKTFQKAQYLNLVKDKITYKLNNIWINNWSSTGVLMVTWSTVFNTETTGTASLLDITWSVDTELKFSFCHVKNGRTRCSKELKIVLSNQVSYTIDSKEIDSCDKDIDKIYQKLLNKKISQVECQRILKNIEALTSKKWYNKDDINEIKQAVLKNDLDNNLSGADCMSYQKRNGILTGTWFANCKPSQVKFNGEKVENLLAGEWYELAAYAGYNTYNQKWKGGDNENFFQTSFWMYKDKTNYVVYNQNQLMVWNWRWKPPYNIDNWIFWVATPYSTFNYPNASFNNSNSTIKTKDWIQWVFIDNAWDDSYLTYDIHDLDLKNFAVEMSVRGAALKRTTWSNPPSNKYTLFRINDDNFLKLQTNGDLKILDITIVHNTLIQKLTDDNKFYRVVVRFEDKKVKNISIYDGEKEIISWSSTSESLNWVWDIENIYIGSNKSWLIYVNQWNDIIDSVKIYTKWEKVIKEVKVDKVDDEVTLSYSVKQTQKEKYDNGKE